MLYVDISCFSFYSVSTLLTDTLNVFFLCALYWCHSVVWMDGWIRVSWHYVHTDSGYIIPEIV